MDLSQRALQTNGKLFSNFKLVFLILVKKQKFYPKTEFFKRIVRREY